MAYVDKCYICGDEAVDNGGRVTVCVHCDHILCQSCAFGHCSETRWPSEVAECFQDVRGAMVPIKSV